jgi:hypothetical protein
MIMILPREHRGFDALGPLVKNAFKTAKIIRKMPISVPPSLFARAEFHDESLFRARTVSALESIRTKYSGTTGPGSSLRIQLPRFHSQLTVGIVLQGNTCLQIPHEREISSRSRLCFN